MGGREDESDGDWAGDWEGNDGTNGKQLDLTGLTNTVCIVPSGPRKDLVGVYDDEEK